MKLLRTIVVGILAAIGGLYLIGYIFVAWWVSECTNYTVAELPSPDQSHVATIDLRECAGESYSVVSLTLVSRSDSSVRHAAELVSNPESTDFELAWSSESELIVRYPAGLVLDNEATYLSDILITYREVWNGT